MSPVFNISVSGNVLDIDPKARFMMINAGTSRKVVRGIGLGVDVYIQILAQNSAGRSQLRTPYFVHTGS